MKQTETFLWTCIYSTGEEWKLCGSFHEDEYSALLQAGDLAEENPHWLFKHVNVDVSFEVPNGL